MTVEVRNERVVVLHQQPEHLKPRRIGDLELVPQVNGAALVEHLRTNIDVNHELVSRAILVAQTDAKDAQLPARVVKQSRCPSRPQTVVLRNEELNAQVIVGRKNRLEIRIDAEFECHGRHAPPGQSGICAIASVENRSGWRRHLELETRLDESTRVTERRCFGHLAIHPGHTIDLPLTQLLDFNRPARRPHLAARPPACVVAYVSLAEFHGHAVDHCRHVLIAQSSLPYFVPTIAPGHPEVGILKQPIPPRVTEHSPEPTCGVRGPQIEVAAHGPIKVPQWTKLDLAVTVLEKVCTVAKAVGLIGELVDDVRVNPGLAVDVFQITDIGIGKARTIEGAAELVEMVGQPTPLCRDRVFFLGIDPLKTLTTTGETCVARIGTINFEDISATHLGLTDVARIHTRHVDSILAALDLLHQEIHAEVVPTRRRTADPTTRGVQEHFDNAHPGRGMPHLTTEVVDERIAHHGTIKFEWPLKHPVGLRRHAEKRNITIFIVTIPDLDAEACLPTPGGARAPRLDPTATRKTRGGRHESSSAFIRLDDSHKCWHERNVFLSERRDLRDRLPESIDDNDRHVRVKRVEGGIHLHIAVRNRLARKPLRRKAFDAQFGRRRRDDDGPYRDRRRQGGFGAVERVVYRGSGCRCDDDRATRRVQATGHRDRRFRHKTSQADTVESPWRWRREELTSGRLNHGSGQRRDLTHAVGAIRLLLGIQGRELRNDIAKGIGKCQILTLAPHTEVGVQLSIRVTSVLARGEHDKRLTRTKRDIRTHPLE